MADAQTGDLPNLDGADNTPESPTPEESEKILRCQWCSIDLPADKTICPTCGSPGVNSSMIVPGGGTTEPSSDLSVDASGAEKLDEWWDDGDDNTSRDTSDSSQDQFPIILGVVGTIAICAIVGVLVAPLVLASVFENQLGVNVEDSNDLRPLGGILGLLLGAFIGAIGMGLTTPRS